MFRAIFLGHLLACVASNHSENNGPQLAVNEEMVNIDTQDNHHSNSSTNVLSLLLYYLTKGISIGTLDFSHHEVHHHHHYQNPAGWPSPVVAPTAAPLPRPTPEPTRVTRVFQSRAPLSDQVDEAVVRLSKEALDEGTDSWDRHTCDGLNHRFGATFRCEVGTKLGELVAKCDLQCSTFKIETHGEHLFAMVKKVTSSNITSLTIGPSVGTLNLHFDKVEIHQHPSQAASWTQAAETTSGAPTRPTSDKSLPLDLPATAKKVQKDCHPDGQSRDYCKQPDRDKMVPCLRNKWAPLLVPQLMGLAAEHCGHVSQLMDHIYPKRMHMAKEFVDAYCGWVKGGRNGKLPKFDCSKYKFQPF
ncbi:hypothetical protein HDE_13875 [Halotydeus destructor]|nr:hypothetical protein HDE_13875 [Halotydeus destructor]